MSTNARFLENYYMMSNKVRSEANLRDLNETPTTTQNSMDHVLTIFISNTQVSHHRGRVVIKIDRFMYLGVF